MDLKYLRSWVLHFRSKYYGIGNLSVSAFYKGHECEIVICYIPHIRIDGTWVYAISDTKINSEDSSVLSMEDMIQAHVEILENCWESLKITLVEEAKKVQRRKKNLEENNGKMRKDKENSGKSRKNKERCMKDGRFLQDSGGKKTN